MNEIILKFIALLHIIFILFVVATPFTRSNYFLLLHTIFVPFMMLHWICNDNTCVLTVIEKYLRRSLSKNTTPQEEILENCFTCRLIEPVYDFNKNYNSYSKGIYVGTIALWLLSAGKLYWKYRSGEITSMYDLFII